MRAALVFMALGACQQDPDQYFRHAGDKAGSAGTLAVMTGAAGASSGAGDATGDAGDPGNAGSAGNPGNAGTTGAAGAVATAGTSGAGTTGTGGSPGAAGNGPAGASGGGAGHGGGGAAGTCAGCKIEVTYTCLSGASDQASFVLDVTNQGSSLFLLKDLTLRYWYTVDAGKAQELDCDTARLTCAYIVTSMSPAPAAPRFVAVTPPRPEANEYVEIAFVQGAIDVGGQTGAMQLRLHNKDYTPMDQSDDYSADCGSTGQAHDSSKVTAYLKGVLVGGTEP
jgi:endoglucanase